MHRLMMKAMTMSEPIPIKQTAVTIRVPDELKMQLVIYAAKNKMKIGNLVVRAISEYLAARVVENPNA